jgi:hypothetical protein
MTRFFALPPQNHVGLRAGLHGSGLFQQPWQLSPKSPSAS